MKLTFLSVYVFGPHSERLLEIHWQRIRALTNVPYTHFVSAPQCSSEHQALLESQHDVQLVTTDSPKSVRGNARAENSYHLNLLAEAAMQDSTITHCLAVHPDSFPIRDGWLDSFVDPSQDGPFVSSLVPNGYSAGLLWNRAFYEMYRPLMLVEDSERESADFERFCEMHSNVDHVETGLGYIYSAWKNDVPWRQVNTTSDRKIYGDGGWFHLVGASWLTARHYRQDWLSRQYLRFVRPLRKRLTESAYRRLLSLIELNGFTTRDGSPLSKRDELEKLVTDPDKYVAHYLRRFESTEVSNEVQYASTPPSVRMGT